MADSSPSRLFTLLDREMQECRNSLFWTPIIVAICLTAVALVSVVVADRIAVIGESILEVIVEDERAAQMNITLNINDSDGQEPELVITRQTAPEAVEDWEFSREWNFNPQVVPKPAEPEAPPSAVEPELSQEIELELAEAGSEPAAGSGADLNPILHVLHNVLMVVLMLVTANYLLSALYQDRKDHSILFWKSLPVSEWEEVLSKLAIALFVAPAIFIGISFLTQLAYVGLAMILVAKMGQDAYQLVWGNIDYSGLIIDQLTGWLLTVLWLAPACAWLLLASAVAKRSPFMMALVPILALFTLEELFLGSEYVASAVLNHIPHHFVEGDTLRAVGFYFGSWPAVDWSSLVSGLVFTAVALSAAVWLRRHRFEI